MAVLVFFGGFILLLFLWAKIADWWDGRIFRKKLQGLQGRFDELEEVTLQQSEQALKTLDELTAAMQGHEAYQQHLRERRVVSWPATSSRKKYKKSYKRR
ncbi:hypothetical protein [Hymenobacter rigui]|uniref:Uncharacterized protein n=1 Tax=Hymenobacter rigui TaxID=334424 RepID=A0A3R9PTC9_9BACT|nr:hypothetical protein [Hymenobacter rigui]RSK45480.1 hypothetical protein EI291_17950 [Hymenobacter rigui]